MRSPANRHRGARQERSIRASGSLRWPCRARSRRARCTRCLRPSDGPPAPRRRLRCRRTGPSRGWTTTFGGVGPAGHWKGACTLPVPEIRVAVPAAPGRSAQAVPGVCAKPPPKKVSIPITSRSPAEPEPSMLMIPPCMCSVAHCQEPRMKPVRPGAAAVVARTALPKMRTSRQRSLFPSAPACHRGSYRTSSVRRGFYSLATLRVFGRLRIS